MQVAKWTDWFNLYERRGKWVGENDRKRPDAKSDGLIRGDKSVALEITCKEGVLKATAFRCLLWPRGGLPFF